MSGFFRRLIRQLERRDLERVETTLTLALVRELESLDLRTEPVPGHRDAVRLTFESAQRLDEYIRSKSPYRTPHEGTSPGRSKYLTWASDEDGCPVHYVRTLDGSRIDAPAMECPDCARGSR